MLTAGTKEHFVKALLYGTPGSGKTLFCANAPKPLWIDYEDSTETLANWPEHRNIPVVQPKDVEQVLRELQAAIRNPEVETVVIDTISTGLEYYLRSYMEKASKGQIGLSQRMRDKYIVHEGDFKYATQVFADLFGILQRAPINVVIIGHERLMLNDEGRVVRIVPDVTPKLQRVLVNLVNVVAYLRLKPSGLKEEVRELYVKPTPVIEAKNRLNLSLSPIENPIWKDVFG